MSLALRALMAELVDYAGLFPPAALDVAVAVSEYARHRRQPESWMLGRFIAPAERLAEVVQRPELAESSDRPWQFSVLVGSRDSAAGALSGLTLQAQLIRKFADHADHDDHDGHGGRVGGLEVPWPVSASPDFAGDFLSGLAAEGLAGKDVFFEIAPGGDDSSAVAAVAAAARCQATEFSLVGAKLRCGGVTAAAFPDCERVAGMIQLCASSELPMKCTAGLHHPVRHCDQGLEVMMHGFLNVFGACLLAYSKAADLTTLIACVAETDPNAFSFDDDRFCWRDLRVSTAIISDIRRRYLGGFGSCSFAEPCADLQDLGMM